MYSTTLRALPQSLSIKRRIKVRVEQTVKNKSNIDGTNRWKRALYVIGYIYINAKMFLTNTIRDLELWRSSMNEIEGYVGGDVGTYFKFLRYLFTLNLMLMVTTIR